MLLLEIEVVLVKRAEKVLALVIYVIERLVELTVRLLEAEVETLLESFDGDEVRLAEDEVDVNTKMHASVKSSRMPKLHKTYQQL